MQPRRFAALAALALVAGCASAPPVFEPKDGPPTGSVAIPDLPPEPVPRPEARSRYGNPANYEVLGRRYSVLDSSRGYSERGVASWYGKKFHGRLTSNRERYNMFAMTAAHKTLPLPTYVQVRNLANGRSIVARVNDRGPFAHNRLIDLSYGAALKLGIVENGTGLVEVTAIDFEDRNESQTVERKDFTDPDSTNPVFVQIGAFGSRENAERLQARLRAASIEDSFIHVDDDGRNLYRVRIGPVRDVAHYDGMTERLGEMGIREQYLVTP